MTNKPINKKFLLKIVIIIIILLLGIGIGIFYHIKIITYYDETVPGAKYNIIIQDNNKIKIITTHFCMIEGSSCNPRIEVETFNYSQDNLKKLKEFIKNNFSNNHVEVYKSELTDKQKEVIEGILFGEYFFETSVEEYKYKIEYQKNKSLSYDIYLKDDNSILVKKLNINDEYDIVSSDTYPLNFSEKNKAILKDYIEKQVKEEKRNVIYKYPSLLKNEINIFNSITENDESYLDNIEYEAKLSYTISFVGIDCQTPTLYLYNDNTYEYYDTYNEDNLIPKTGTYDYDIKTIINNIDKYKEDNYGQYIIKDENQKSYTTYKTNIELQNFLKKLNINLDKCIEL